MRSSKIGRSTFATVTVLSFLAPSILSADDMAYFIGIGGQFGTIDLNSGAVTMLGTSVIPNSEIAGLGVVNGTLYTAAINYTTLYTVNPASGAVNAVGSSIEFFALGSTTTGLYAAGWPPGTNTQANPQPNFYSIDPRTGAATMIGQFGPGLGSFYAWSLSTGSSTLYFVDYQNLYSIDTTSGTATLIGGTSSVIPGGLTYENGTLYACSGNPEAAWTLNAMSGAATLSANISGTNVQFAGLAPLAPPVTPQVLSQFVFGGGRHSAVYFTNWSVGSVSFTVNFVSDNGTPLTVPSIGASTTVNLAPQATTVLEGPGTGTFSQGYVTASVPNGVSGYGVVGEYVGGRPGATAHPVREMVVPFSNASSTTSTLSWDDTSDTTDIVLTNPSPVAETVTITVWDSSGNVIGDSSVALAAGTQVEKALRTFPGLAGVAGKRGSASFAVSAGSIAVLGLRDSPAGLNAIPVGQQ